MEAAKATIGLRRLSRSEALTAILDRFGDEATLRDAEEAWEVLEAKGLCLWEPIGGGRAYVLPCDVGEGGYAEVEAHEAENASFLAWEEIVYPAVIER